MLTLKGSKIEERKKLKISFSKNFALWKKFIVTKEVWAESKILKLTFFYSLLENQ